MKNLDRMPNERPGVRMRVENQIELPPCCPVSGNPQPGSTLTIRYRPRRWLLEVYSFKAYIQSFVGGHEDGTRNMETMLQKIAQECATLLDVPVLAYADLVIAPSQKMRLAVRGAP